MIWADFQQGMESVFSLQMNSVWKWLAHLCSSNGNMTLHVGIIFSYWDNLKLALRFHALLIMTILSL